MALQRKKTIKFLCIVDFPLSKQGIFFVTLRQNEILLRSISFLFYINIVTSCAGGFEQPVSDALRPVGQKHPLRGVFRARLGGFTSSHQNEILSRSISFLFYINIVTSCAAGFEFKATPRETRNIAT